MPVAVPIAMVAAAGIGAVASNSAAKKGAQAQTDAANAGIAAQNQALTQSQAILQPYVDLGLPASGRLGSYEQAGLGAVFGQDQAQRIALDRQISELQGQADAYVPYDQAGAQRNDLDAQIAQLQGSIQRPWNGVGPRDPNPNLTAANNRAINDQINQLTAQRNAIPDDESINQLSGEQQGLLSRISDLTAQRDALPANGQGGLQAYTEAGLEGLQGQRNLLGLGGADAQQQAYDQIMQGPAFKTMMQQGENSILQNASATGGLRGGNVQGALAQFSPQLLNQLINQQYSQYSGLSSQGGNVGQFLANSGQQATTDLSRFGQASAAGQAASSTNTGNQIALLRQDQGAAQAGQALAQGQNYANLASSLAQAYGAYRGQQIPQGGANSAATI